MTRLLLVTILAAVAACGATFQPDIQYRVADGLSLKMDASIPDGKGPFPTIILVHGGGWRGGDKATTFKLIFDPLTRAGFAWFSVNYRMLPKYHYPAAVDDVVEAIRYVEAHAREYKVDRNRLAIAGESAGGHIVSLIGARDGRKLHLAAVVAFYPVTDFDAAVEGPDKTRNAYRAVMDFLGVTELNDAVRQLMREASPVTYVNKGMPPFLFVHGTGDATVNFHQSEEMCAKMKRVGASCEIYAVAGAPHWIGNWEKNPEWQGYKQKVPAWLKQTLQR